MPLIEDLSPFAEYYKQILSCMRIDETGRIVSGFNKLFLIEVCFGASTKGVWHG